MKVVVRESGNRPVLSTPARINAPQGAKALADLLAVESFADMAILTIDYDGDGITPAFVVKVVKWFPQFDGRILQADWVMSLDDLFGVDNFNGDLSRQIVFEVKQLMEEKTRAGPASG